MFYRVQLAINGVQWGWWETHWMTSTITIPNQLDPMLQKLAQLRANMLGSPFAVVYARASQYSADGVTRVPRGTYGIKVNAVDQTGAAGAAEPGNVAILIKGFTPATKNWDQFWLGAPPDAAVDAGGRVQPAGGAFLQNFNVYANFLTGQNQFNVTFGWGLSGEPQDYVVASFTQVQIDGTVQMVLTQNVIGYPASNLQYWPARIRGVNKGRSVLNGYCTVQQTAARTIQTSEQISFGGTPAGGKIKIYNPVKVFTPYSTLIPQPIVGEHRRGRPIGFTRGRQPVKIRS